MCERELISILVSMSRVSSEDNSLGDEGVKTIEAALRRDTTLRWFDIGGKIEEEVATIVGGLTSWLPREQHRPKGALSLAKLINKLPALETLHLSGIRHDRV